MTPGPSYSLSVTPKGIRRLIRRKVYEQGVFKLRIKKVPDSDQWTTETEWTPLNGLKGESPEALLHALSLILSPDPDATQLEPERLERK